MSETCRKQWAYYCSRIRANFVCAGAFLVLLLCAVCDQHASPTIAPMPSSTPSKDTELIEQWQQLARECRKHLARQEYDKANACAKSLVALAKTLPRKVPEVLVFNVESVAGLASEVDRVCNFAAGDRLRFAAATELERAAWEASRKQDFAEMLDGALRARRAYAELLGNSSVFAENMTLDVVVAAIELDTKSVDFIALAREFTERTRKTYGDMSAHYGQSLILEGRVRRVNGELEVARNVSTPLRHLPGEFSVVLVVCR